MLKPAFVANMSEAMADVYGAVTDKILINLAKYFPFLKAGVELPGSFDYQARMLAQMGQINKETIDIIMSGLDGADQALRQALEASIIHALEAEEPKLRKAAEKGILQPPSVPEVVPGQMQAFKAYYRQSADKLNLVNTVMLESTQAAYTATVSDIANKIARTQSILNVGAGEVVSGVTAYNQAVRESVRKMVSNGITGFIDHGGHHWTPEAYAAMGIRTTMNNVARAATWERNEGYGNDLYQVSWHNGARPLCYPWQGKVISRSDLSREVEDLDGNKVHVYAQSETSYGEAAGLFGVNCGHYAMVFIPGISTLYDVPQDEEENAKDYEESQQQRALERKLRYEKRDVEVMKARGVPEEELKVQRERVKKASRDIDDFCEETGRTRRRDREATPINAKFPPKESYIPELFPTEERDKMREFFKGNTTATVVPQQTAQPKNTYLYNSVEDFDKEIEALRAKRAELFEADDYDKAETDRLLRQIQELQDKRADWVSASNLANGDARLTNMLCSDDPVKVVGAVDEILNKPELELPQSHWNGTARVRSAEQMPNAAGYAHYANNPATGALDGMIDLQEDYLHEFSTAIHEDIHQRSRGDLSLFDLRTVVKDYSAVEEGTTQLMTEEVCKRLGYPARKTYSKQVNAFRDFHKIIAPKTDDYTFAKRLLDRSPFARYNYVMDSIEDYRTKHPRMRVDLRERLNNIEETFKKGAKAE